MGKSVVDNDKCNPARPPWAAPPTPTPAQVYDLAAIARPSAPDSGSIRSVPVSR